MKLLLFVTIALLAGCAALQPGADEVLAVDGMLSEVVGAARAPASEQKAALARAQQAFAANPSPVSRVKLAALLATLPVPLRDDARAAELLEPVADASSPGTGRFAAFLSAQIAERQRLAREVDRLVKERATFERERQASDKERDKREEAMRQREEAMRQQLEALRAIERGIIDREERVRRKPGGKP